MMVDYAAPILAARNVAVALRGVVAAAGVLHSVAAVVPGSAADELVAGHSRKQDVRFSPAGPLPCGLPASVLVHGFR